MAYQRIPLVEVLAQAMFQQPLSAGQLDRSLAAFKKRYEQVTPIKKFDLRLDLSTGLAQAAHSELGSQFRDTSGLDVVVLDAQSILISRLAPFLGWEALLARIETELATLSAVLGSIPPLSRVSTRFVNRLDLPIPARGQVEVARYVRPPAALPVPSQGKLRSGLIRLEIDASEPDTLFIVQAGTAQPMLIDYESYLLDLDVLRTGSIPRDLASVRGKFDELKVLGVALFESLITDELRILLREPVA